MRNFRILELIFRYLRRNRTMSLLTFLMLPLMMSLGFWQLSRAADKIELLAQLQGQYAPVQSLEDLRRLPSAPELGARALLHGHFLPGFDLLLDNQPQAGQPGWVLLSPFQLAGGGLVLTTRAWLPVRGYRDNFASTIPPLPASAQQPTALQVELWPPPPSNLSDAGGGDSWPKLVQKLDMAQIGSEFDGALAAQIAWSLTSPGGQRLPQLPSAHLTPQKHYSYAVQWFALSLTLLVLYLWQMFRQADAKPATGRRES